MKGLLHKAKAELNKLIDDTPSPKAGRHQAPPIPPKPSRLPHQQPNSPHAMSGDQPSTIQEPTGLDMLRYRYHHGANLGSVYVLERWLFPSRFPSGTTGSSELAAVQAWVDKIGVDATKKKFEDAWAAAVSEDDIQWLANDAKCRLFLLPLRRVSTSLFPGELRIVS